MSVAAVPPQGHPWTKYLGAKPQGRKPHSQWCKYVGELVPLPLGACSVVLHTEAHPNSADKHCLNAGLDETQLCILSLRLASNWVILWNFPGDKNIVVLSKTSSQPENSILSLTIPFQDCQFARSFLNFPFPLPPHFPLFFCYSACSKAKTEAIYLQHFNPSGSNQRPGCARCCTHNGDSCCQFGRGAGYPAWTFSATVHGGGGDNGVTNGAMMDLSPLWVSGWLLFAVKCTSSSPSDLGLALTQRGQALNVLLLNMFMLISCLYGKQDLNWPKVRSVIWHYPGELCVLRDHLQGHLPCFCLPKEPLLQQLRQG